ncbi:ABC transporter ATP-binding protein [Sphingomonas bacterium]|uniref:ABC transporter ATP-binding protein n=1 Tax=Sphingomonas bacterium TaxID=1895847 RepID=UPI001575EB8F|nr:ABC transporter ATP-binding protein [Sphingomonas bacterium]
MTNVVIEALTKRYGTTTAIDSVSLSIGEGEFVSLLGPSGCGKSTTLRLIAGFETADTGRILFDGEDVAHLPPNRRDIGMVFQSYALFPHMTVAQNLAFGLEMRKMLPAMIRSRVAKVLEMVRLVPEADRYPRALSGGQQQRVALARALVIEPRILLLDEPLANLDAKLRDEMREFITDLQRRVGITTIYVTHDQAEAMAMSDRIVVMFKGEVAQFGAPRDIYERPQGLEIATFIGQANFLQASVTNADGRTMAHTVLGARELLQDAPAEGPVSVLVRPEALTLANADEPGVVSGSIDSIHYSGSLTEYRVRLPGGEMVSVQVVGPGRQERGDAVGLRLAADPLWTIGRAA